MERCVAACNSSTHTGGRAGWQDKLASQTRLNCGLQAQTDCLKKRWKATKGITDVNLRLPHVLVHLYTCAYIHTNRHTHVHISHTLRAMT